MNRKFSTIKLNCNVANKFRNGLDCKIYKSLLKSIVGKTDVVSTSEIDTCENLDYSL